ncbi:hypothetical protein DSO57_1035777 [Entomophthora muscae]|uniref:Uncharacterized protein n=1 Tax=Entomophthora muscae TaxID=34485 RepID=A0ACC2SNG5_9FUNG|nr:hypothetical protein DSO57_1035777 [Entomophthora muscae]
MLLLSFLVCLVKAEAPLKVMVSMGLGTNSHIKPLLEMGAILRERNHTVFYSSFESNRKFNKPYQLAFVSLGDDRDAGWNQRSLMKKQFTKRENPDPSRDMATSFGMVAAPVYDKSYPVILKVMEQERPDVVLCDFLATACRDAAQMLAIPLITGFQATDFFGVTSSPFVTSTLDYGTITTESLSFMQRFHRKVIDPLIEHYRYYPMVKDTNVIRAKYNVPPASHPFGDFSTSLGLASSFIGFEASILFPPNIRMIGPIKSISYPPLTPDLAQFLETHPKTLYIAFGSIVILGDYDIENLVLGSLAALEEGSIDGVIWGLGNSLQEDFPEMFKFNGTEITRDQLFSGEQPHIKLLPWAPQTAILEHESTKLFISHGGLESSFEAILSGTPILCMPFLGDQFRNARKLEDAGIAKYINRANATPTTVSSDIKHILQDTTGSFASHTQRMRTIAQYGSRRKDSGADAIEEYAYTAQACRPLQPSRYGEIPCELKHLTLASRNMSYLQSNLIDVYAFAILLSLLTALGLTFLGWRLATKLYPSSTKDLIKKEQ